MYFLPIFLSTLTFEAIFLKVHIYCKPIFEKETVLSKYRHKILVSHNIYRQLHQAPDLELSPNLTEAAQSWAKNLLRIGYVMPSGTKYGENMLFLSDVNYEDLDTINIVEKWYEPEVSKYPNGPSSEWEHFTQIVWKSTKWLGVGIESKGEITYIVCYYEPRGNIDGQYEDNVTLNSTILDPAEEWTGVMSLWISALMIFIILSLFVLILILVYYHWT